MHRFFISVIGAGPVITIPSDQQKHMEKVLRLKSGDRVICFDGSGREYTICLQGAGAELRGTIESCQWSRREPAIQLHLVQGLVKGDKMDFIIQKSVELGIKSFYPLATHHSVVTINEEKRLDHKLKRWQKVAVEACKQSGRSFVPAVNPVLRVDQFLAVKERIPVIVLDEKEQKGLKQILPGLKESIKGQGVFLLIGPEGGFSREEILQLRNGGAIIAGLGPRVLRSETAAVAAAAVVMYELDQME